ncbi:bifunctional diaminohydroxyphosphoribosylaminopyrimidine deaminase/5-amino-6-(5-phosphoribosylamino)uracil reductase RibD [Candidatus Uhrbacteria bacterium]|nr:bifunctional diaminohydroxyphosphoribosylaminopyrimidine deaminase/5-amino-6-(5-phosphoribosylamino)uracil reductase RibD [Candidatus Uhrbacteria bacterium]
MRRAITLAERGVGFTSPNPCVGAVVVKDSRIIGEGYHRKAGMPHAEIEALRSCIEDSSKATMYVTLEPCTHEGKTPPCTSAIRDAGIKRVVIGTRDPNPNVSGNGAMQLQHYGIEVTVGVEEHSCRHLIRHFARWATVGIPSVICKVAVSKDYKIAAAVGKRTSITSEQAQKEVHTLRHAVDAIIVGAGTVAVDDPFLTDRSEGAKSDPLRIILDGTLRTSVDANVYKDANVFVAATDKASETQKEKFQMAGIPIVIFPKEDDGISLPSLLAYLGKKQITSLLVEGGGRTIDSFMRKNYINEWHIFQSTDILGPEAVDICSDIVVFKSIIKNAESRPCGRDTYFLAC